MELVMALVGWLLVIALLGVLLALLRILLLAAHALHALHALGVHAVLGHNVKIDFEDPEME